MAQFKHPLVLGINQDTPSSHMALPERLAFYGQNTGNLLFAEALFQVVDNAQPGSYHFKFKEADHADAVVIAAANWINAHSDFGNLAGRLKKFGRPVILVGIGIQASDSQRPKITAGTRALLDLAAETSASISARGYYTEEALKNWGYDKAVATGCPSLLLSNGRFTSHAFRPTPTADNTVLMGTRHLMNSTSPEHDAMYRIAYGNQADILMQSELADMYFIENTPRDPAVAERANAALTSSYGDISVVNIRNYLIRHGKVFFHAKEWRSYLQGKEYAVGTRIHGIIATLLSGRRGILLSHDQRTAELAQIMGIPSFPLSKLERPSFDKIVDLIDKADFDLTGRNFLKYYDRFKHFFSENGLGLRPPRREFGE